MKILRNDARGIAHVGLIVVALVAVAAIGFAGWRVMSKDKASTADNATQKAAEDACNQENKDQDLCKFITGWKDLKQYHVEITNTGGGRTDKATFESDDNKTRMVSQGEMTYEIINIGDYMFTKASDGTWWKQQIKPEENLAKEYDYEFKDPDTETEPGKKTSYERLGKEACGDRQCFKYKVVEPAQPEDTQYIWFDDQDYLARRIRIESKDGSVSEQTFAYDNVKITEPSPAKDLGPNQYIIPGQTEPVTLPTAP